MTLSNWKLAYMVATAKHIGKMPVWTDSHYKYRVMYVEIRIAMSQIRLYFKYVFRGMVGNGI